MMMQKEIKGENGDFFFRKIGPCVMKSCDWHFSWPPVKPVALDRQARPELWL